VKQIGLGQENEAIVIGNNLRPAVIGIRNCSPGDGKVRLGIAVLKCILIHCGKDRLAIWEEKWA